jgi:hypothetical protein
VSATFIPSTVGTGQVSIRFRTRTLQQWATLTITGLAIFYQNKFPLPPRARAAAIGLLFPGAGYIACANILGAFAFVLTQALLALSLVAVSPNFYYPPDTIIRLIDKSDNAYSGLVLAVSCSQYSFGVSPLSELTSLLVKAFLSIALW